MPSRLFERCERTWPAEISRMKWSGRRPEKSLSGKAVFRVDTRRKCTFLRFESVAEASGAAGVMAKASLVTYRDSLTSSLPKQEERPASFISGEKDILVARVSIRLLGNGGANDREEGPPVGWPHSSISSWPET